MNCQNIIRLTTLITLMSGCLFVFPTITTAADTCITDNTQASSGISCALAVSTPQVCCAKCTCMDVKNNAGAAVGYRCEGCPAEISVTPPKNAVSIPGFTGFTTDLSLDKSETFYQIPWIAEYISAIYKFGVGVAVVLAIVMIVFGGFVWMTAGGNAQQVTTAKGYILGAIGGVVLALGSYSILYLVNPNLTKLSPITVPHVAKITLEMAESEPEYMATEKLGNIAAVGDRATTDYIIIHTAAGLQTRDQVDAYHKSKGWAGIGYNFYIERNGNWVDGRGEKKIGAHTVGYNAKSIGVSYAGCLKYQVTNQTLAVALAKETIVQAQYDTLIKHVKELQAKYHIPRNKVLGHNEIPGVQKACPCIDMNELRLKINP